MLTGDQQFQKDLLAVLGRIADALEGRSAPVPPAYGALSFTPVPGVPNIRCDECERVIPSGSLMQRFRAHVPGCRSSAMHLPAPRRYLCAVECGHSIAVHSSRGCESGTVCECTAPHGRIMPAVESPVPDDLSGLGDAS